MSVKVETPMEEKTWEITSLPNFQGMKCHVLGGAFHSSIMQFMKQAGFENVSSPEEADLIVFAGGADVDPELYGQKRMPFTQYHRARDDYEKAVYEEAVKVGKPMFGICRGAQFLHVMNGGQLWQHVENHAISGTHTIWDLEDEVLLEANSYHHQMLALNDKIEVLACTKDQVSKIFISDEMNIDLRKEKDPSPELEIEAGMYYDTKCFFVQGHPEVGNDQYRSWTMHKLMEFLDDCDSETYIQATEGREDVPGGELGEEEVDPTVLELMELEKVMINAESEEEVEKHMAQWRSAQGYI